MKELVKYGVAAKDYTDAHYAASETYMSHDSKLVSTPLTFDGNPFNDDVKNAKVILDLGCGVGRNLEWIMENTNAIYIGLEPNSSMLQYFWTYNEKYRSDTHTHNYKQRIRLVRDFHELRAIINEDELPPIDVVVCTFVFQHIGFRPGITQMNVADITKAAQEFTRKPEGALWIMYEHDWEEPWIDRWEDECNVTFDVYERSFDYPLLTDRGRHHLMIWHG